MSVSYDVGALTYVRTRCYITGGQKLALIISFTYTTSKRTVGQVLKPFRFSSKPEQLGLTSSIRLEIVYVKIIIKSNFVLLTRSVNN